MIKVFDDIVDIFDQEIIKHQILNETYHQYIDDVSIANNQHQRRPGFKHIFDLDILHDSIKQIVNNCNKKINTEDPFIKKKLFLSKKKVTKM